ncbi:MAG: hypothetical protein ACRDQ7_24625 [Haloechinothrix sp.]
MTSSTEDLTEDRSAPAMAGIEARLRKLISRGYQFIHPTDASGGVVAVVGVRVHDEVVDVVSLNAEDDVVATRMPGTEVDILAPQTVLWQCRGHAQQVLDALIALPDQDTPGAAELTDLGEVTGCWVPVRPGTSTWLPTGT